GCGRTTSRTRPTTSPRRSSPPSARETRRAPPARRSLPLRAPAEPLPGELRRAYAHLDEVPSAALKTRRARVPVTVSLTAIRSQAPASTSSNVRGEYGSTL